MIATLYPLNKFEGQDLKDNKNYISKNLKFSDNSDAFIFIVQEHGVVFYPVGCGIIEDKKITLFIEDDYSELREQLLISLKEQNYDSTI